MKQKEDNPIKTLFEFSGDAKGKMSLSVILTVLSELFGMLPYLTAAMLANEVFAGTATIHSTLIWAGIAATGIILKTLLGIVASSRSHKIAFTICAIFGVRLQKKCERFQWVSCWKRHPAYIKISS